MCFFKVNKLWQFSFWVLVHLFLFGYGSQCIYTTENIADQTNDTHSNFFNSSIYGSYNLYFFKLLFKLLSNFSFKVLFDCN